MVLLCNEGGCNEGGCNDKGVLRKIKPFPTSLPLILHKKCAHNQLHEVNRNLTLLFLLLTRHRMCSME